MTEIDRNLHKTDGDFSSHKLELQQQSLVLEEFSVLDVLKIGNIIIEYGTSRNLSIATEVRIGDWTVFHASFPGSSPENDWWMNRKARVVMKTGHSSLYERVLAEENGVDWFAQHGVSEEDYAIHGGGLPINVKGKGLVGVLLISGLPQVQDHLLGVEILSEFLARKGETV
jgi:uncharacterized protein (UPF0303 family)